MKIIKFFSSFSSSKHALEVYKRLYHLDEDPNYNTLYKFTENDDYTDVIILNTAMPNIKIKKENVIGLAFEPLEFLHLTNDFIEYAKKYIGKYYIGDTTRLNLPLPFIEHYSYMWHITVPKSIFIKKKCMSIMISDKHFLKGHKYRHLLTQHILKLDLNVDIYGRGCVLYNKLNNSKIKGKFDELEPYENYYFHIAIENTETPHYFSEKITNPLLCNTNVIYLGCNNIHKYFDSNYVSLLDGNINNDISLIKEICENPLKYYKTIEKQQIVDTINITNII
jgi:hypothetical protein